VQSVSHLAKYVIHEAMNYKNKAPFTKDYTTVVGSFLFEKNYQKGKNEDIRFFTTSYIAQFRPKPSWLRKKKNIILIIIN
jgi:hypothetical protein